MIRAGFTAGSYSVYKNIMNFILSEYYLLWLIYLNLDAKLYILVKCCNT